MRTEQTHSQSSAVPTLADFTQAIRDASSVPKPAGSSLMMASELPLAIPHALAKAAETTLHEALEARHPVDPLLGPDLSRAVSALTSIVKRSGGLIEKALAASLERAGFVVMTQVAMQLTGAARDLVANNPPDALRGVAIAQDAPSDGPTVVFDLLVYCRRTKRAWLLEVKRGSGATELRKIKPITTTLLAGALQVKGHLARMGLKVRRVEARVVDYYGRSGFAEEVRVTGDDLDRFFGAPVRPLVEAVLAGVKAGLFQAAPRMLAEALAAAHQPERESLRPITLPGGIRVAPEHLRQIELPAKRKGKPKPTTKVIAIGGPRRPGGPSPATVR
jgi:hypothetical protein